MEFLEPTHSKRPWIFGGAILLGVLAVGYISTVEWHSRATDLPNDTPLPSAVAVDVVPVASGPITEAVRAVGTLAANESVILRPEIPGVIRTIRFQEGQAAEKGTVLIELDDSELRAQVAQVEAELKMARLTHARMKQLTGNQNAYISQQQIDQALSQLQTAEANHTLYLTRLAKTKIRAPFTGYTGIRRVSPGDYVQAGQDLVNLEDLQTLKIDFKVPETSLKRLSLGQRVDIMTDAYPADPFTGEVYAVDPRVDAVSRAVHVRASIPNAGTKLRPGLFANVTLVLGENTTALLIPEEAVLHMRDKTFVYRVEDGTARLTEVDLGARERGLVQTLGGVEAGAMVVRVGHQKLKDGMRVELSNRDRS